MKKGIILSPYEEKNASGIALCILNQAEGLIKLDEEGKFLIYSSTPVEAKRIPKNGKNILIPSSLVGKQVWFLKNYLFNKKVVPDVLIFNMPLLPLILPRSIKTIPVFYELMYEAPKGIKLKRKIAMKIQRFLIKYSLVNAAAIVTPSVSSKNDLVEHYGIDEKKVVPIYLGFQKLNTLGQDTKNPLTEPFFLFVGKIKYKKNIHGIIDGFIKFKKNKKSNHKLVLAGDYGVNNYYHSLMRAIKLNNLVDDVVFTGYVNDKNLLLDYYSHASGLVFCTLQEGFGMPIVEAMDLGIPVITSDRTPMNEVAGGAGILVDPEDTSDIAKAMEKLAYDESSRNKLIELGFNRAKDFSWEKHNKEFDALIDRLYE